LLQQDYDCVILHWLRHSSRSGEHS